MVLITNPPLHSNTTGGGPLLRENTSINSTSGSWRTDDEWSLGRLINLVTAKPLIRLLADQKAVDLIKYLVSRHIDVTHLDWGVFGDKASVKALRRLHAAGYEINEIARALEIVRRAKALVPFADLIKTLTADHATSDEKDI